MVGAGCHPPGSSPIIRRLAFLRLRPHVLTVSCMKDYYAALHLRSSATLLDIKKAFRQQASIHHPDRNDAPEASARFRAVQEAYDVLSDAAKRKAYDDNRQRNLLDSPIDTARTIWLEYFNRIA
jgi:hypothetical protein